MNDRTLQTQQRLDFILACGGLAGPEKERILRAVMRASRTGRRRRRSLPVWRLAWAGLSFGVTAALLWVLVQPRLSVAEVHDAGGIQARGEGGALRAEALCAGPCRPGGTLLLRLEGLPAAGYVAAYAQASDGARIWYFPALDGTQPYVQPGDGPVMLPHGIHLGSEHAPGHYDVHVLVLPEPVTRAALMARGAPEAAAVLDVSP